MVTLYYIHDPMCSWCWGFRPAWDYLQSVLKEQGVPVVYLLGGLAPDTDQPMPIEQQKQIQEHWYRIRDYLGTEFNFDFWINNQPRRSTYPACRAVLAARLVDKEFHASENYLVDTSLDELMIDAIQRAYYLRAMNPSDNGVLALLFDELIAKHELPDQYIARFVELFRDYSINQLLFDEIQLSRSMSDKGFPSLVFYDGSKYYSISVDYSDPLSILEQINACIAV